MNGNGNLSTKLQVFDGKNWNQWMIQMRVLFGAQDVLDLINDNYVLVALLKNAIDVRRNPQRDPRKKDMKTLFYTINVWMQTYLRKLLILR